MQKKEDKMQKDTNARVIPACALALLQLGGKDDSTARQSGGSSAKSAWYARNCSSQSEGNPSIADRASRGCSAIRVSSQSDGRRVSNVGHS